jgi:ribosomal protein S18 acetylase RimI-like enzyme
MEACLIEDLLAKLDDARLGELLASVIYNPTAERLARMCGRYRTDPMWKLLGCRCGGAIVGCIGIELGTEGRAIIRHISVAPAWRSQGIGTALIQHAIAAFALTQLVAETDLDAVEFYRKCGFTVRSLGEKYPGTERFLCSYIVDGKAEENPSPSEFQVVPKRGRA